MNLGKAIKVRRIENDLTQTQLAERAGLSVSYLSLLERNRRDPAFSTVRRLADALRTPLPKLVDMASKYRRTFE